MRTTKPTLEPQPRNPAFTAAPPKRNLSPRQLFVRDQMLYYFSVLFPLILSIAVFVIFFTNDNPASLDTAGGKALFISKFIWIASVLLSFSNIIGLLVYGSPRQDDLDNVRKFEAKGWNRQKRLLIVYVSRGDNHQALGRSLRESLLLLHKFNVNYRIDVVTDMPVSHHLERFIRSRFHVVPHSYFTRRYAQYKARALHYLVEHRERFQTDYYRDTWILHLDEESVLTPESLAGISKFINTPANRSSIGQGEIKYNSFDYGKNILITAVDSVRSGDDLGRFRFQYKMLNKPIFGMHGSFILVPAKIERELGFDLGGKGSITEDAYFALHAAEKGYKFNWVEGFIREQSPFTIEAIIRQRRRWYCGLSLLAFDRNLKFSTRGFLMLNTVLWTVGWVGPVVTLINLAFPRGYAPLALTILAATVQGAYMSVYMVGSYRGSMGAKISKPRKLLLYVSTLILIPVSGVIEGLGILYGIVKPVRTFDVVKK